MTRDHQFYVAVSKFAFAHPEYGIVAAREPIILDEAASLCLSPLLIYGLAIPGIPLRWLKFGLFEKPFDLKDVLNEGWASGVGLKGPPKRVQVSRFLAEAAPNLHEVLRNDGIELVVAGGNEKSLPTALRIGQAEVHSIFWGGKIDSIDALNNAASDQHISDFKHLRDHARSRDQQVRNNQWLAQDAIDPVQLSSTIPWKRGKWLHSWENLVPPECGRYFFKSNVGSTWLLSGSGRHLKVCAPDNDFTDISGTSVSAVWTMPGAALALESISGPRPSLIRRIERSPLAIAIGDMAEQSLCLALEGRARCGA